MNKNIKQINLQKILSLQDLQKGLKRLRKKNKVKHPRIQGVFLRFLKQKDKDKNALATFIDEEVSTEKKLLSFYKKITNYEFSPYQAYAIPKNKKGTYRPLLVPEPRDRLIFDSLFPIYKKELEDDLRNRGLLGLGLEKGQSILGLLNNIYKNFILNGYTNVLTMDYSSFFSTIDRAILLKKLKICLSQTKLSEVLKLVINNQINNGIKVQEQTGIELIKRGIPQGLSFSPLLACFYALEVDDIYIKNKSVVGFRYIDDILILSKSKNNLNNIHKKIKELSQILRIKVHDLGTKGKTEIKDLKKESVLFLGAEFTFNRAIVPDSAFEKFLEVTKNEIFHKKIIDRKKSFEIKKIYYSYVKGWLKHYADIFGDHELLHKKLDDLLYNKFFKKKRERLAFYKKNEWIKLCNNNDIKIRPKKCIVS